MSKGIIDDVKNSINGAINNSNSGGIDWDIVRDTTIFGGALGSMGALGAYIYRKVKDNKKEHSRRKDRASTSSNTIAIPIMSPREKTAQSPGVMAEANTFALASLGMLASLHLGFRATQSLGNKLDMIELKSKQDRAKKKYNKALTSILQENAEKGDYVKYAQSMFSGLRTTDNISPLGRTVGMAGLLWLLGLGTVAVGTRNMAKSIHDSRTRERDQDKYFKYPRVILKETGKEVEPKDYRAMVSLSSLTDKLKSLKPTGKKNDDNKDSTPDDSATDETILDKEDVQKSLEDSNLTKEAVLDMASKGEFGYLMKTAAWGTISKYYDKPSMSFDEFIDYL